MGQQQLLLIIVGTVIVAIAIMVGIWMFRSNAVDNNRNGMANYLTHLGALAQAYYENPTLLGGGGRSFAGYQIAPVDQVTDDGNFTVVSASPQKAILQGIGVEIGVDGANPTKITVVVLPDSIYVDMSAGYN